MFRDAVKKQENTTTTYNGAAAHREIDMDNPLVQFFSRAGSYRASGDIASGVSKYREIMRYGESNLSDYKEGISKLLLAFWVRDPRGGIGERELGRGMMAEFERTYGSTVPADVVSRIMEMMVHYGRWDDLLLTKFTTDKFKTAALKVIDEGLKNKDLLCFKWMPRPGSRNKTHRENAQRMMKHLGMDQYEYQRFLSSNSDTVEQKICAREFKEIDYSKIPSGAHLRHIRSFFNNDESRFSTYLSQLNSNTRGVKINAGAVTPYNILNGFITKGKKKEYVDMYDNMFDALADFTGGRSAIPMIDTSGSMHCGSNNGLVIDVALSIGTYCSMKNPNEKFKNLWLAFSSNPKLGEFKSSSFITNCMSIRGDRDWGMSTNIEAAYKKILDIAKENNLEQSELPEFLIILSDMQFNQWSYGTQNLPNSHKEAQRMFRDAGYETPTLVYWNLAADHRTGLPFTTTDTGALICSGQSPTILPAIFNSSSVMETVELALEPYVGAVEYILTGKAIS